MERKPLAGAFGTGHGRFFKHSGGLPDQVAPLLHVSLALPDNRNPFMHPKVTVLNWAMLPVLLIVPLGGAESPEQSFSTHWVEPLLDQVPSDWHTLLGSPTKRNPSLHTMEMLAPSETDMSVSSARYTIVALAGASGVGQNRTHVSVPLQTAPWSSDTRKFSAFLWVPSWCGIPCDKWPMLQHRYLCWNRNSVSSCCCDVSTRRRLTVCWFGLPYS